MRAPLARQSPDIERVLSPCGAGAAGVRQRSWGNDPVAASRNKIGRTCTQRSKSAHRLRPAQGRDYSIHNWVEVAAFGFPWRWQCITGCNHLTSISRMPISVHPLSTQTYDPARLAGKWIPVWSLAEAVPIIEPGSELPVLAGLFRLRPTHGAQTLDSKNNHYKESAQGN